MPTVETISLGADEQVVYIDIEILDDGVCEGMERFEVVLSTSSPGCAIQDSARVSSIVVIIIDDESMLWLWADTETPGHTPFLNVT